ncbi:MAG: TonB-dependent receptor [Gammaproteobacteria bacterium]|nr:TonB-dependent receptor [Gammaproteobacteria bacterium]
MQRTTLAAVIAGLFTLPVQAQDIPTLDEIVVTATRLAQPLSEILAATEVITRNEIDRSGSATLTELLSAHAGINLAINGGAGKSSAILLRGTNADHVLVLVDGLKMGSATTGTTAFQDLPLDQIERIEIVRGPRSTLYGSGAIGGVIQIFTRPAGKVLTASAGLGSQGTRRLAASMGGQADQLSWRLNASHFMTDGINSQPKHLDTDRDGYENNALSMALDWKINPEHRLKFDLLHAQGKSNYDGTDPNFPWGETTGAHTRSTQQVLGLTLNSHLSDRWNSTLRIGQSADLSDTWYSDSAPIGTIDTHRNSLSWQNDLHLGQGTLTLGADAVDDRVSGNTAYARDSRLEKALFGQYRHRFGQQDIQVGLRRLDNAQFGGHTSGDLGWGYALADGLRLTASYGTAFKAPTFNQLYWPGAGNPALQPETSKTWEAGLRANQGVVTWGLNLYRTEVANLIDWRDVGGGVWLPTNTSRARMVGGEVELGLKLGDWAVHAVASNVDPVDTATGRRLPRRASWTGRLDADRSFGKTQFGLSLHGQDMSYDNAANSLRLPGFALADIRVAHAVDKYWSIQAHANNLFDKEYATVNGYASPGRGVFVGLSYRD